MVFGLTACGREADRPTLKPQWYDYDGARLFRGFFDTRRMVDCRALAWSDGNIYCVPTDAGAAFLYADAACTQLVASHAPDPMCQSAPPSYFVEFVAGTCGDTRGAHIYERGAKMSLARAYSRGVNGSCTPSSNTREYYALGSEVSVDTLAQLTPVRAPGDARLTQRFYSLDDGTQVPTGMYDNELSANCSLRTYEDGVRGACVPSISTGNRFHDAACSERAFEQKMGCPKPEFTTQSTTDCDGAYFAIGSEIERTPVMYSFVGTMCSAVPTTSTSAYFGVGAQVFLAQLPRERDSASGARLQYHYFVDGATRYQDTRFLYDVGHQTECADSASSDGSHHCLPAAYPVQTFYSDMACSTPLKLAQAPTGCGAKLRSFATEGPPTLCTDPTTYSLGDAYTTTVYCGTGASACAPVASGNYTLYRLGAPHSIDEFPRATIVTDP